MWHRRHLWSKTGKVKFWKKPRGGCGTDRHDQTKLDTGCYTWTKYREGNIRKSYPPNPWRNIYIVKYFKSFFPISRLHNSLLKDYSKWLTFTLSFIKDQCIKSSRDEKTILKRTEQRSRWFFKGIEQFNNEQFPQAGLTFQITIGTRKAMKINNAI